jgi:tetratricopeptide (TPR) repeat protein
MRQVRIFISHSHEDNQFCDALVRALRESGADVWYDEHNLGAGRLLETITRELDARSVFIVILSKPAFASNFVRLEVEGALNLLNEEPHRVILPVVAQPIEKTDFRGVWLLLAGFKRVEAPGYRPFALREAVSRTLEELALTPRGKEDCILPVGATAEELVADAKSLYHRRQCECAALFCQGATQLKPDYFSAWYWLAYALYDLDRNVEALMACEQATTLRPNDAFAWNLKGYVFTALGRYKDALIATRHAVSLNPRRARYWANHGTSLINVEQYAEALAALDQALAIDPKHFDAIDAKIQALAELERYDEALAECERILLMYPTNAIVWQSKGGVLYEAARFDEALNAYNHALALAPKLVSAWQDRANTLEVLGRDKEARETRRRVKELIDSGVPVGFVTRGWHTRFN